MITLKNLYRPLCSIRRLKCSSSLLNSSTGHLHFPPPVGILPGAGGKVLLIRFAGQVFLIENGQGAGRGKQEAQGVAGKTSRGQSLVQLLDFRLAGIPLPLVVRPRRSGRPTCRASMSRPVKKPASVGRSWVVVETGRLRRIIGGLAKAAVAVPFEPQQPVAEDAGFAPAGAAPPALTVPRSSPTTMNPWRTLSSASDAQQIVGVSRGRRRRRRRSAIRNPVQPEEAHDVIDAQRSAVPRAVADGLRERAGSRWRGAPRDWAAESPSPGRWARSRREARPRGSPRHRTRGGPTGPRRSGRWPGPDRDTGRSSCPCREGVRLRLRPICRSSCHCRNLKNRTRARCSCANSFTAGERGS